MQLINPEIRFEVTNICNAQCIMCPREKMKRPQGVMDMELYKRVLDEAVTYGATQVSLENYGEPLCDPLIIERIRYAKKKGLEVLTITNASLLDKDKSEKIIRAGLDVLRISMYGITKETYEKVHKGLLFEVVERNILELFKLRKEINKGIPKPKIDIYFIAMEENRDEADGFRKKWEGVADDISIWKPHNWGDGRQYRETNPNKKSCGRPMIGPVQVQWDGKVVPCCFDYDSRIILGDLNKQTLREVLRSKEYNDLREAHLTGHFEKYPFCNCCDQLNKRDDALIYSTIKFSKVGAANTNFFDLERPSHKR